MDETSIKNAILAHDLTPSGAPTTVANAILNGGTLRPKVEGLVTAVAALGQAVKAIPQVDTDALETALAALSTQVGGVDEAVIAGLAELPADSLVDVLRQGVQDWQAFKDAVAATP